MQNQHRGGCSAGPHSKAGLSLGRGVRERDGRSQDQTPTPAAQVAKLGVGDLGEAPEGLAWAPKVVPGQRVSGSSSPLQRPSEVQERACLLGSCGGWGGARRPSSSHPAGL